MAVMRLRPIREPEAVQAYVLLSGYVLYKIVKMFEHRRRTYDIYRRKTSAYFIVYPSFVLDEFN